MLASRVRRLPKRLVERTLPRSRALKILEDAPVSRAIDRLKACETRRDAPNSVLLFTVHKCASTFINDALAFADQYSDLTTFNYTAATYLLGDDLSLDMSHTKIEAYIERHAASLFVPKGELYGPFRRPVDFIGREKLVHIFFLRDPRDVLVSSFYSFGFSHGLPPNRKVRELFLEERRRIQDEGIDAYCLRAVSEWIAPLYEEYARFAETAETAHKFTYDDYRRDPYRFLAEILKIARAQGAPEDRVRQLAEAAAPVQAPSAPDAVRHKRSGRSKQFVHELKPETLRKIEDRLSEALTYWRFD